MNIGFDTMSKIRAFLLGLLSSRGFHSPLGSLFLRTKYWKLITLFILFVSLSCFFVLSAYPVQARGNPKYASLVMDADTGLILSQRYANKKLHPASLTKLMTLLLAFEVLDKGKMSLSDRIRISKKAASMQPSKLGLSAGSTIKVEDAIYALVTKSANDVAVALAEHMGGTEKNFARVMTIKAHQIGMHNTTFRNASGLHHSRQISTARDMAKLARTMLQGYPDHYHYFSTRKFSYRGKTYNNHNRLMRSYRGMDGMKTGYINASGFNLVASAKRNDRRLIGVVFGGRTSKSRNAHMAVILDRGFKKLQSLRLAHAKVPLPSRKPGVLVAYNALKNIAPASGLNDGKRWALINPQAGPNSSSSGAGEPFEEIMGQGDTDPSEAQRIEAGLLAISSIKGSAIPQKYADILAEAQGAKNDWASSFSADALSPSGPVSSSSEYLQKRYQSSNALSGMKPKSINVTQKSYQLSHQGYNQGWSIQVGAFKSRAKIDKIIRESHKKLPRYLQSSKPLIVPLKTSHSILYRGRLTGYTEASAKQACQYLKDCMPISPSSR